MRVSNVVNAVTTDLLKVIPDLAESRVRPDQGISSKISDGRSPAEGFSRREPLGSFRVCRPHSNSSYTTTLNDSIFLRRMVEFTGNVPGEGGLITFPESNWLMSIVVPFQPHFIDQPKEVTVFWGYGLHVDVPGNFVNMPMSACTGREIMTELLGHLHFDSDSEAILKSAICIPCMMPFITSQFMPREEGDRPHVVPEGYRNLAFIGQYCELPNDVVFTVEYSIRSAQYAVSSLLGLKRQPPKVYKGATDPRVLFKAFKALHDMAD